MNNIITQYFSAYSAKDLAGLKVLLAEDLILRDWEYQIQGRDKFLEITANAFTVFPSLNVDVFELVCDDQKAFAKIGVKLKNDTVLDIVDYFILNDGMISEIHAYRQ